MTVPNFIDEKLCKAVSLVTVTLDQSLQSIPIAFCDTAETAPYDTIETANAIRASVMTATVFFTEKEPLKNIFAIRIPRFKVTKTHLTVEYVSKYPPPCQLYISHL